jgi:dephospho-CoA kinase
LLFIVIAGMPGAGKSIVAQAAKDLGLPIYNMGDVVREETLKIFGVITPDTMRETSRIVRDKYGKTFVAEKTIEKISNEPPVVVIDGVRSLDEVSVFRKKGKTLIVAIHASPKTRFKRLLRRGRAGDPRSWDDFVKRDMVELGFGLGNVIALSDYMIVNESSIEHAYLEAKKILKGLVQ